MNKTEIVKESYLDLWFALQNLALANCGKQWLKTRLKGLMSPGSGLCGMEDD